MADSSKTEKATPKKRRDERKKGNIFFSNDAVSVVVLLASFGVIQLMASGAVEQLEHFMRYCMGLATVGVDHELADQTGELLMQFLITFVKVGGPILATAVVAGIAVTFFQTSC